MTGIDSTATLHSVAGLRFGNDGSLFVGIGDGNGNGVGAGTSIKALDIDLLNGKILRIDPVTGRGISSNPYYQPANPGSVRSRVFARGFRNPFRFTVDPTNGTLYVGDVGWNTWEMFQVFPLSVSNPDVNRNAGWPCYEGGNGVSLVQPDYAAAPSTSAKCHQIYTPAQGGTGQGALAPLYGYLHDDPGGDDGSAIAGGPRYLGTSNYPDVYIGKVFIGDYARSRIQIINLSTGDGGDVRYRGYMGQPRRHADRARRQHRDPRVRSRPAPGDRVHRFGEPCAGRGCARRSHVDHRLDAHRALLEHRVARSRR